MDRTEELGKVFNLRADQIDAASERVTLKHGMFANVPLLCKGALCKYCTVCNIPTNLRINGQRCLMEAGTIVGRFKYWLEHFNIDDNNDTFKPEDRADVSLIIDLVKTEVQILRVENKIAIDGDFMAQTIVDVDKKCKEHKEEIIHPALDLEIKLTKKKDDTLRLLNATRKDKVGIVKPEDANSTSITIIQKVKKKAMDNNIDLSKVDFSKMDEVSNEQILEITKKTENNNVANDNTINIPNTSNAGVQTTPTVPVSSTIDIKNNNPVERTASAVLEQSGNDQTFIWKF